MAGQPGVKDPLSGHPGHLSPGQSHTLEKFKEELSAEGLYDPLKFDDAYLLRFLRARKFDLPKAKIMWSDFIKWRTEFAVDELYEHFEYPELAQVDQLYPQFYHKTDKDGRPIYIEILGKLDVAKLFQVTTSERQLQRLVVEYERFLRDRLPICSEVSGRLIETSCTIMDLKHVGVSQFWKVKNQVQAATAISSNNYPETMGKLYIINAPWAFTTVWGFVKTWLDEVTVAKITILGGDYLKTVSQQVPLENLPSFLGGKCHCREGCTLSNAGPWQDPSLMEKIKSKRNSTSSVRSQRPNGQLQDGHNMTGSAPISQSDPAATLTTAPTPLLAATTLEPEPQSDQNAHIPDFDPMHGMTVVVSKVDA